MVAVIAAAATLVAATQVRLAVTQSITRPTAAMRIVATTMRATVSPDALEGAWTRAPGPIMIEKKCGRRSPPFQIA